MEETKRTEFFYKLSDKLDELFPKGDKRRGDALVLNAFANIYLVEEKKKAIEGFVNKVGPPMGGVKFLDLKIEEKRYLKRLHQEEDKNDRRNNNIM